MSATSGPGFAAKPVIGIALTVADPADEAADREDLARYQGAKAAAAVEANAAGRSPSSTTAAKSR